MHKRQISLFALMMLITGSIDSIRNLPASALFGSSLIIFFTLAGLMFLLPAGFVSAELASTYPEEGGVYNWVSRAFGSRWGMLAIWLQWINTMIWYPTILSFIAATLAYIINPALEQNKGYMIGVILISFWSMTLLNLRGIKESAWMATVCTVFGMIIPMTLIIGLGSLWISHGHPMQISFEDLKVLNHFGEHQNWISLTAIMTAFLGMELATVHVREIHQPQHVFPKAILGSALIIVVTMLLGSLSIAIVIPKQQINLIDGVMVAFNHFFEAYQITWVLPIIGVMLLIGSLGGMINWIISPARGMVYAAEQGYLPRYFAKQNSHHVASRLLILQAIIVSAVCLVFLFIPNVNTSYWLLTDLSTELYMAMYLLMFIAAIVLRYKDPNLARPFQIPAGKIGLWITAGAGIVGCIITLVVGFFVPEGVPMIDHLPYPVLFASGLLILLLPVLACYAFKNRMDIHK